jgi:hypothetical protein
MSCGRGNRSRTTATFALIVLLGTATNGSAAQSAAAPDRALSEAVPQGTLALQAKEKRLEISQEAEHVSYHANTGDGIQVSYFVHESFPGKRIIEEIRSRLTNAGWKPFATDSSNATANSLHTRGWRLYVDETDGQLRDYWTWKSAWQDDKGDLLEYIVSYSRPFRSKERLSEASVSGSWTSAAKATADREAAKRARESAANHGQR